MATFLEFFAGGGMARLGLGNGWSCLVANDIDEKKAASYRANWGDDDLIVGDVAKISSVKIEQRADLAWASFPCQDLSLAGNYAGLEGERSGTFWSFWRIIRGLKNRGRKPRMVMIENVFGTLTSRGGNDFEEIANTIAANGYRFGAMVIDAVHFVPQSRPRVFILAVDQSIDIPAGLISDTPDPAWHPAALIKAYNRLPATSKQDWIWWNLPTPAQRLRTLDDIVDENPVGVEWHSAAKTREILRMMTPLNRKKVLAAQGSGRLKVGTIYKRTRNGIQRAEVRFDGISGCLRTPAGGSSRQIIMVVDGATIRTRLLAPREAARLMGLPATYQLPKRYNDAYALCGDGVVVHVVAHLRATLLDPIVAEMSQGKLWQSASVA